MTKAEAIEAMKQGKWVTHSYFLVWECITSNQDGTLIIFEDGTECTAEEFWTDPSFSIEGYNSGWEVV